MTRASGQLHLSAPTFVASASHTVADALRGTAADLPG